MSLFKNTNSVQRVLAEDKGTTDVQEVKLITQGLQSTVFFYCVGKIKPTQFYFRFNAIHRTTNVKCETD